MVERTVEVSEGEDTLETPAFDSSPTGTNLLNRDENSGSNKTPQVIDFEQILLESNMVQSKSDCTSKQSENVLSSSNMAQASQQLSAFSTQGCGGNFSLNPQAIRCANDGMFLHVPVSLRSQIVRGEYVNLALLIKGAPELSEICAKSTLQLSADGRNIESAPKSCKDRVSSIEKWTDAFLIYMSILLVDKPELGSELLQYMHNIRDCAKRQGGYGWREYDEQFRLRQASYPASWAQINNDLWWRSVQVKEQNEGTAFTPLSSKNSGSTGICKAFNKGFCHFSPCKFLHTCYACSGEHSLVSCGNSRSLDSYTVNTNSGQSSSNSNSFRGARSRPFNRMHRFTSKQGMRNGRFQPYARQ